MGLWVGLSSVLWVLVGVVGASFWLQPPKRLGPDEIAARVSETVRDLELTSAQEQKLEEIVRTYRESVKKADREFADRLRELQGRADTDIESLLTEEQRDRYLARVYGQGSQQGSRPQSGQN